MHRIRHIRKMDEIHDIRHIKQMDPAFSTFKTKQWYEPSRRHVQLVKLRGSQEVSGGAAGQGRRARPIVGTTTLSNDHQAALSGKDAQISVERTHPASHPTSETLPREDTPPVLPLSRLVGVFLVCAGRRKKRG